jgi:3'(2'), 5'-bisphosphate nucleotidase
MKDVSENMLLAAIKGALAGGSAILKVYETAFEVDVKADSSPLTEADRQAHLRITQHLKDTGIPVLSEEGRDIPFDERKNWQRFWLVDPLDGTKEFVKRNGEFTVNIALVENGVPIAGVIYVPVSGQLFVGIVDQGAFSTTLDCLAPVSDLNNLLSSATRLPISRAKSGYTVVGSRSHMSDETLAFVARLREAHGDVKLVSMGSSLKLCLVANGTADVYPRFAPTMEWDTAAGHAIAVAAGCKVTMQDGITPLTYNKENLLNPWFIVSR